MKKKVLIISLALVTIIGILIICFAMWGRRKNTVSLDVFPVKQVNYNHYLGYNQLDIRGDYAAFLSDTIFGTRLTLVSASGETTHFSDISAPFQLMNDQIIFLDGDKLQCQPIQTRSRTLLATNVQHFIALPHALVYTSTDSDYHEHLYWYDWESGSTQHLHDNIVTFRVHEDAVYILDQEDRLMRLEEDLSWSELTSISADFAPIHFLVMGDCVVYEFSNKITFVNIHTGESEFVRIAEDGYVNNSIDLVCDEEQLFVSFQATTTNGSLVLNKKDENNGVWCIDPKTKEKTKLCDDTFEQLYLYEGNQLFGVRNNKLYQIDVDTGDVTKVSI